MVGPVSRGRALGVSLIWVLGLGARPASAGEAEVTVKCAELSGEDSAQIEARVRASLLSGGLEPTRVELSCEVDFAQTQVTGNGHQVMLRSDRHTSMVKEALLASADGALAAWSAQASPSPLIQPHPEPAPAPVAPSVAALAPPAPAPPPRSPDARPAVHPREVSTWLFAGPRVEWWSKGAGLGAQLGLEQLAQYDVVPMTGRIPNRPRPRLRRMVRTMSSVIIAAVTGCTSRASTVRLEIRARMPCPWPPTVTA